MNVAIIDADLIGRKKHRFPNLACMKISSYHKKRGDDVVLKTDYNSLKEFDKVYLSKVFTDTIIPGEPKDQSGKNCDNIEEWYKNNVFLKQKNLVYGGTGFSYENAKPLDYEIEHIMPDYHLYDEWVNEQLANGGKRLDFKYYLDYSIGFLTRGCFRQCEFCVNKNYKQVFKHSPLEEFHDATRRKICLLDDNFLGCPKWKEMLLELQDTKKPFQFKQGLDERLLTDEKCELLFSSKYDGDYIFAFDNVKDSRLIEKKLQLLRKHTNKVPKFYTLCGFDREDKWDDDFWKQDLWDLWARIELLMKYNCLPYVMRFNRYEESPYRGMYVNLARWCNQPSFYKKKSFREFCIANGVNSSCFKYMDEFEKMCPEITYYYDLKFENK